MGMLRLDWNIVATIINLIVLYLLMRFFLFGPIQAIIDKRKQWIDSEFDQAKEVQEEASQMKNKYEDLMEHIKEESNKILEQARAQAKVEYDMKLEQAKEQADKLLEAAREKIETEREKMLRELERQISSLAMCAAAKVIGRNASSKYDDALYKQFFGETGETNETNRS